MTARSLTQILARSVLSTTLAVAALLKLQDPSLFAAAIERYQLVGPSLSGILAFYLPWLELVTALMLWCGRWRAPAALLASTMLFSFSVAIAASWWRGLAIDCGCFGKSSETSPPLALTRSLILGCLAVFLVISDNRRQRNTG